MAQTAVKELEQRNKQLEEEIHTLRELFQNLHEEKDLESSDQRRAFMLKAQNYQLERQCMLLSQSLSNRASVLTETECQLQRISGDFQAIIAEEKSGPNVVIKRAQIMEFLGTVKKLKNSIFKQSQLESSDTLRIPSLMSGNKYSKTQKPLDCLDVCKANPENLNLRYIAGLEQNLSALYKRLCAFKSSLDASVFGDGSYLSEFGLIKKHFTSPTLQKLNEESTRSVKDLQHCCDQLVTLSLLHPSAPWSAVQKSADFDDIKFEKVMQSLPQNAQKNSQVRAAILDVCKAHNYVTHMQKLRMGAMETRLQSYQATAKVQQQYLEALSSAMRDIYSSWKEGTVDGICRPIASVLQSWSVLKDNQSGENLKKFLGDFKKCESELQRLSTLGSTEKVASNDDLFVSLTIRLDEALQHVAAEYDAKVAQIQKQLCEKQ